MTTVTASPAVAYGDVVHMPVHFDDLDAMGVLHNSRYAVLVERATVLWWTERGVSFSGGRPTTPDAFNVVREYAITFHRPVRGTGEISVHFWIDHLGTTSVAYGFRVTSLDGDTVFAEGRRVNVRLDPATMRPVPWTDHGRGIAATLLRG
ncbi:acyl-CoA thioesterase [Actinoplanes teichomyceticus]|uniref:Acyl-CoA thioester hydrolase n=1 Tax=Actinoplanes teichomyceticus TaxID=1867 RepID=A0A561VCH3_ACTTI|nr:thioesterase family protein [Actinoplanes teichomyceticus]TWG09303.1 acyl-CoA thioester hydrolase [Actinoplanes teichomyceticus]GIF16675.1 thioesterase [Actinoplanes teichomyceticus]